MFRTDGQQRESRCWPFFMRVPRMNDSRRSDLRLVFARFAIRPDGVSRACLASLSRESRRATSTAAWRTEQDGFHSPIVSMIFWRASPDPEGFLSER